jgi:hypothetical protein
MARRGSALGVVAALASLLLAACSSGDGDAVETTSVVPTAPPDTAPPSTPPAPTDAPTTTAAPPTTIDPAAQLAAAVEADLLEAFDALYASIQDPNNDATVAAALDWHLASNREFIADQLETFRTNSWVARPNPVVQAGVYVEVPAVLIEPSDDVAELQVCEVDSWIVVEPGAGPDGADALVNDELTTYRSTYFVRYVDGRWRIEGSSLIGTWLGLVPCPTP